MVCPDFEEETEERKEYIKKWFLSALNNPKSKEEFKLRYKNIKKNKKDIELKLLKKRTAKLEKQRDLLNYFGNSSKKSKKAILNYIYNPYKKYLNREFKEYVSRTGKSQQVALKKSYGKVLNKKVKVSVYQFLVRGNFRVILRDKKGRFASPS